MKTTLKEILSHDPCGQKAGSGIGWALLTETLGTSDLNTEVDLMTILKSNGIRDAIWALRTQEYLDYCLFSADVAELALPVFGASRPDDSRVRDCIQAIRDFKAGEITSDELRLAAADAAAGAAEAAWFADAVAGAAGAARDATWSAAWAAAMAAAESARVAAWSAAWAAARDAAGAARNAAEAVGWTATWIKIEELFVKHFGSTL